MATLKQKRRQRNKRFNTYRPTRAFPKVPFWKR